MASEASGTNRSLSGGISELGRVLVRDHLAEQQYRGVWRDWCELRADVATGLHG
jgi:hypothetical protein